MICRPAKFGKSVMGHPVIFPKNYFEELKLIEGDLGARNILLRNEKNLNRFDYNYNMKQYSKIISNFIYF